jgi:acyl-CoA reductase-like NAD-dependent aldehyde dehydrogenase
LCLFLAIEMANSSKYGLAAILWTNDLKRANRVGLTLQSGTVWVNCWMVRDLNTPFGGMKQSGIVGIIVTLFIYI